MQSPITAAELPHYEIILRSIQFAIFAGIPRVRAKELAIDAATLAGVDGDAIMRELECKA